MKNKLIVQVISCVIGFLFLFSIMNISPVYAQEVLVEITTPAQFNNIRNNLSGNYRLMADIDLAAYTNWVSIGSVASPFTGQLDGNGYTVRNLFIADTQTVNQGLFGVIGSIGTVSNLRIEGANVTAADNAGILAGFNQGTLSRVAAEGIISGMNVVGGLVGSNSGTITNAFAIATVRGRDQNGGLVGTNSGTLTNTYAASSVSQAITNNYVQFDGVDDYISIPHNAAYVTASFTLEAWLKSETTSINFITGKGSENFEIHTSAEQGIRFIPVNRIKDVVGGDLSAYNDIPNVLKPGWNHIAASWDYEKREIRVFLNGVPQDIWQNGVNQGTVAHLALINPNINPLADNTNAFFIGARNDHGGVPFYFFKGKIADVRFWSAARTTAEIASNKYKQLTGSELGLIGYWKLDEAAGTNVLDSSSVNNTGSLLGGATRVQETSLNGGLAAINTGSIVQSYYDSTLSGLSDTSNGTPLTTLLMKKQNSFTNWVFPDVWKINENTTYPTLFTLDTAPPAISVEKAVGQADPTSISPVNFKATFSEPINLINFTPDDVTLTGIAGATTAVITEVTPFNGTTFSIKVSGMTGDGTVTASINAGKVSDLAGNTNTASTSTGGNTIIYDKNIPSVTINQAVGHSDPSNSGADLYTVTFSETVSGFSPEDISFVGSTAPGTLTAAISGTGPVYTVSVSGMTGNGIVTASIPAGKVSDSVGNLNTASTSTDNQVTLDISAPTAAIIVTDTTLSIGETSLVTFTFSEAVTGFTNDDLTITNATLTTVSSTDGGITWTATLAPTAGVTDSTNIITLDNTGLQDSVGNTGSGSTNSNNYVIDTNAPTVTINQAAGQADPTNIGPVNYTVIFSELVTGFGTGDVTLVGSAGATTATITGSGTTYNVAVSGMTIGGTIIATVLADAARDSVSNGNAVSSSTDNTISFTFDTTTTLESSNNPTVIGQSVAFTATVSSAGGTPTGTVEFCEGAAVLGTAALSAGKASFITAALPLGTHNITAYYLASIAHNVSQSTSVAQVVKQAATTSLITSSMSPAGIGSAVTFTTAVTANAPGSGTPTGAVEFFDEGTSLGKGVLTAGGQAALTITTLTVGSHSITAAYSEDTNYIGSTTTLGVTQVIEGPPGISQINSVADTGDAQILEDEHINAAITQLLVLFGKAMNVADAQTLTNYVLLRNGLTPIAINSVVYDSNTLTATLNLNNGAALPNGQYSFKALGTIKDTLGTTIGADFTRNYSIDLDSPLSVSLLDFKNNLLLINGGTSEFSFSELKITFTEDVNNAGGGMGTDDVTNPLNYLLLQAGPNKIFDTKSCESFAMNNFLPFDDDVHFPTGQVTYSNNDGAGPFVATVQLNGGTSLTNGSYQLLLCGSTSIVDLAGNPLNHGLDEALLFNVLVRNSIKRNPPSGFAPHVVTRLPKQPSEKAYTNLGDLWIEIPTLDLKAIITGVSLENNGWDVSWLNQQVGWLEGTAYPGWSGNTVLTAHAYTADGIVGPFVKLKDLSYGQFIIIHQAGRRYTYVVKDNFNILPANTYWLTKHEELDWITLITCQQYDEALEDYRFRRVVRAVLINVE